MKKYFKLLRVKHYVKNVLILLPALFSKQLFNVAVLPNILYGFISFCLLSSVVYIFNDLCDVNKDRNHPAKCNRPIAKGEISVKTAVLIMGCLLIFSVLFNFLACEKKSIPWILLLVYFIQNVLYSLKLKQVPVIDVALLASGFLLRVFYGSAVLGVEVSKWLYLTVIAVSFYLGFGKRRNELALSKGLETRSVLSHYTYDFLDKNMYVCSALTIVFYSLWCVDGKTSENFGSNALVWTVPVVILICIAYSLAVEKGKVDDPIDILFESKLLLFLLVIYGISVVAIVYSSFRQIPV